MAGRVEQICDICGSNVGFSRADDGFFYCSYCNSQVDDIINVEIDDEEIYNHYNVRCKRVRPANITVPDPVPEPSKPNSEVRTSQFLDHPSILDRPCINVATYDEVGPTEPSNFASRKKYSYEDYYTEIRSRYVTGLQFMIQLQSRALVEKFNVSPLIIGLVGPLWLRLLASTKILADDWADQAVLDSEAQTQGEAEKFEHSSNYKNEPFNIYGKRVVYVWYRSLRSALPISCSLALSLLVCHVAREPILPTDILKWALEGKLPYLSAFLEIEKQLGSRTEACPIRVSHMFRPIQVMSSQKLETAAADIAQRIGLKLPPVNFHAIASRYLSQLSFHTAKLFPSACRIYEWTLFDINGYGMWESSFSSPSRSSSRVKNEYYESQSHLNKIDKADDESSSHDSEPSNIKGHRLSVVELLQILDAKYSELSDSHEYSRDLPTYLKYYKDVAFFGLKPSFEDREEEELIAELWAFYQNNKGATTPDENDRSSDDSGRRRDEARTRGDQSSCSTSRKSDESQNGDHCSKCSTDSYKCSRQEQDSAHSSRAPKGSHEEKALRQLKLDMKRTNSAIYRQGFR